MRAWLQLLRLPNLFTAASDVLAGFFFAYQAIYASPKLAFAALASILIYAAGVVLNDVFDAAEDRKERPHRPIPSGRVRWSHAAAAGAVLLVLGWFASYGAGRPAGLTATALVVCVLLYDGLLKGTILGPLLMGLCRGLNLSLGLAAGGWDIQSNMMGLYPVAAWTIYVTSVTFFARREAGVSRAPQLRLSLVGIFVALAMLALMGLWVDRLDRWYLLGLVLAGLWIGPAAQRAVRTLEPADVQRTVSNCLFSLILLGASLAWAMVGPVGGLWVAVLLVPTLVASRWLSAT